METLLKPYVGICLILATIALVSVGLLYSCASIASRSVEHVRDAFAEVLKIQPQVIIGERVILTQTFPIAELAVVTKEELVTLDYSQHLEILSYAIPLTGKKLEVEATYRIKAGFNLRRPFTVRIDPVTHQIRAALPAAEILSVEQVGDLIYHGEDATLNRITDEERGKLLNELAATAHSQAESSSLKTDAQTQVELRLQQILAHNGEKTEINWDTSPAESQGVR